MTLYTRNELPVKASKVDGNNIDNLLGVLNLTHKPYRMILSEPEEGETASQVNVETETINAENGQWAVVGIGPGKGERLLEVYSDDQFNLLFSLSV